MNYQEIQYGGSKLRSKESRKRIKKILGNYERDKDVCKIEHKGDNIQLKVCMDLAEERKQQRLDESNQLEEQEKEAKFFPNSVKKKPYKKKTFYKKKFFKKAV